MSQYKTEKPDTGVYKTKGWTRACRAQPQPLWLRMKPYLTVTVMT